MSNRLAVIYQNWSIGHYALWGVGVILALFFTVVARNLAAVGFFFAATDSVGQTFWFFISLFGGLFTLFSPLGSVIAILFSILISLNVILLWQYVARQRNQFRLFGGGKVAFYNLSGTVAAILGIGCASCGTAVLFSILSLVGGTSLILWLPLGGEEFGIIGILGLVYSTWYLLDKLRR